MRIVGGKDATAGTAVGDNVGIILVSDSLVVIIIDGALVLSKLLPSVGSAVGSSVGCSTGAVSVGESVL